MSKIQATINKNVGFKEIFDYGRSDIIDNAQDGPLSALLSGDKKSLKNDNYIKTMEVLNPFGIRSGIDDRIRRNKLTSKALEDPAAFLKFKGQLLEDLASEAKTDFNSKAKIFMDSGLSPGLAMSISSKMAEDQFDNYNKILENYLLPAPIEKLAFSQKLNQAMKKVDGGVVQKNE